MGSCLSKSWEISFSHFSPLGMVQWNMTRLLVEGNPAGLRPRLNYASWTSRSSSNFNQVIICLKLLSQESSENFFYVHTSRWFVAQKGFIHSCHFYIHQCGMIRIQPKSIQSGMTNLKNIIIFAKFSPQ